MAILPLFASAKGKASIKLTPKASAPSGNPVYKDSTEINLMSPPPNFLSESF